MGKRNRKRCFTVITNNDEYPVDAVVVEYQLPVLQINELMALKYSKLDELCLRAVLVNNISSMPFSCRETVHRN